MNSARASATRMRHPPLKSLVFISCRSRVNPAAATAAAAAAAGSNIVKAPTKPSETHGFRADRANHASHTSKRADHEHPSTQARKRAAQPPACGAAARTHQGP